MRQKEIILAPFPFTDLTGTKLRPALIISSDFANNGEDIIIAAITSKNVQNRFSIPLKEEDFIKGKLLAPSSLRYSHVVTLKKSLVIKTVAQLTNKKWKEVQKKLHELFS